jgi:DNA-binding NarL/FixJ family response regulator
MKILILEDHPGIFHLLEMIVREVSESTTIEHHLDWKNALQTLKSSPPDYVITDIQIGEYKQLELMEECKELKIPFMVFSGYMNSTILGHCDEYRARVVVAKSAPIEDLKLGIQNLLNDGFYRCSICSELGKVKSRVSEEIPRVLFTQAEEFVILAQIEGKTTLQLSEETRKSIYTIRNQRMKLMEKNGCTMEEIVRRYLFWHTKG